MADPTTTPGQSATAAPGKRLSRHLMTLLKLAIAVVGIWYVMRDVHWNELRQIGVQASAKWHLLVAAWMLLVIPFLITAIRWRGLLVPQGINLSLGKSL